MDDTELAHYRAALDEIYRLRTIAAMYADHTEADLTYKTYPKSRRTIVEQRIAGLRAAARGKSETVLAPQISSRLRTSMRRAGAPETLTRAAWEARNRQD